MRVISVYVSEKTYAEFKRYAQNVDRPVAELIREAMESYRSNRIQSQTMLKRMPVSSGPKLKRRWTREEIQEELFR
jgi:hypothetical protein